MVRSPCIVNREITNKFIVINAIHLVNECISNSSFIAFRLRSVNEDIELKLKKVYFFWICPDTNAFEWFSEMLEAIETHMTEQGRADFLQYNIFLTRGWTLDQVSVSRGERVLWYRCKNGRLYGLHHPLN